MDASGLRRRDTTKGTPLRVLSLDGGGVRGYSMLILLHDFMHKTYAEIHGEAPEQDQVPRPCDYFDLIAGTGTGGLIAIMLGRLRMNTRDCMRVYVQMTRKVFETDKTIAGIPYRSTLFKASMLEDAIRSCVRTFDRSSEDDWNDVDLPISPESVAARPQSMMSGRSGLNRTSSGATSRNRYSQFAPDGFAAIGDPNAPLEDTRRERRCKTAVTAVLKGHSERSGTNVLLRSYPSRTQSAIEPGCAIWQAGRATCATKLAFKEIRIGTSTFLDEGYGLTNSDHTPTYNPAPQVLEEAIVNEWPGQQIGLLLSIGTGRRPSGTQNMQSEWWEGFAGGLSSFAEAKRKLIAKIEGCEKTHKDMYSIHLPKRGIKPENYLRLNVEVGVGEFGMNEWNRLADISNGTQSYLNTPEVTAMLNNGAREMAKVEAMRQQQKDRIQTANQTFEQNMAPPYQTPYQAPYQPTYQPPSDPNAVELPAFDDPNLVPRPLSRPGPNYPGVHAPTYATPVAPDEKFTVLPSDDHLRPAESSPMSLEKPYRGSNEYRRNEAPPLPPKTPIPSNGPLGARRHQSHPGRHPNPPPLPYPDTDGPPPVVNMARKPEYVHR